MSIAARASSDLQVLARGDDALDVARPRLGVDDDRLDGDDAVALPARDLRPVVGIAGVRQVLVLLELLAHGGDQIRAADALVAAADVTLERELLRPAHDRLDHGARGEV